MPAYEDETHWCFNTSGRNPSAYSACSSKLAETGVWNTFAGAVIYETENHPPDAHFVAASVEKIRQAVASIPDFDTELAKLLLADDTKKMEETQRRQTEYKEQALGQKEVDEARRMALAQKKSEHQIRIAKYVKAAVEWRKTVKEGTESHCGLVIQVRPSIAEVQTMIGAHWFKVEQLLPPGIECAFLNSVYVEPKLANDVP